jgi:bilirubin oxidase
MIWNITNQSMMPHPWHIHGNYFYIKSINGQAPPAYMKGRKDVVTIPPMNGSAQIVMKYEDFADSEMPYMYHCHILSHEDGGMMGQFMVEDRTSSVAENSVDEYLKTTFDGDQIFILSMKGEQIDDIRLFNQMGQLVLRSSEVSDRTSLPIKNIVSGIYIVSVSIGKKVLNKKIFIF